VKGQGKPHTDREKEITNNWNYDIIYRFTFLMVLDLENFKRLVSAELVVKAPPAVTQKKKE